MTIGYIGCGTQGLREMTSLITNPALQIVAVCDPNKFTTDYVDWSPNEIRYLIRKTIGDNSWGEKLTGIPGGRDVGQELVQKYYGKSKDSGTYKGCSSYADFRELLAWSHKPEYGIIKKWIQDGHIGTLKEIHTGRTDQYGRSGNQIRLIRRQYQSELLH